MTITLTELQTQVRQRADMENSNFVTDTELTGYINASIAELHDLLISAYDGDYYITAYTFSTVANTDTYALPAAFYKLKGVDIRDGSDWVELLQFNFRERNVNTYTWNVDGPSFRYRLQGSNVALVPTPTSVYSMRLWYIPVATKLVSGADTLADLNQYSEYVVLDAAIKCKEKEEGDVSVLAAQKMAMQQRIVTMAANRDAGTSETIIDVYRGE